MSFINEDNRFPLRRYYAKIAYNTLTKTGPKVGEQANSLPCFKENAEIH